METMRPLERRMKKLWTHHILIDPRLFASQLIIDQFSNCEVYYEKNYIGSIIGCLYLKNKSDVNMITSIRYKAIFI